jgi:hypothetical protein
MTTLQIESKMGADKIHDMMKQINPQVQLDNPADLPFTSASQ